jgi:hypothetical protein
MDHVIKTSQDCKDCSSDTDADCPVCDWGLAVCSECGEYEEGLKLPCTSKYSTPSLDYVHTKFIELGVDTDDVIATYKAYERIFIEYNTAAKS